MFTNNSFMKNMSYSLSVTGNKAKAYICLALCERLCNDPETRRDMEKLRTEIEHIQVLSTSDEPKGK